MAFEAILSQQRPGGVARSKWRHLTLTLSVLLHAAALAVGLAHSVWQISELPLPPIDVTLAVAPPPPAPAPPSQRSSSKRRSRAASTQPRSLVPPKNKAKDEAPPPVEQHEDPEQAREQGADPGATGGLPGGTAGGPPQPQPEKSTGPKLLSMRAGNELLVINPNQRPYRLNVPEELTDRMGSGDTIGPILQICVTEQGSVRSVRILTPSISVIDAQIPVVIPRWKYRPLLLSGQPQPFCYVTKYSLRAD